LRAGRIVVAHVRGVPRSDVGLYDVDPRSGATRRFSLIESHAVYAASPDGRFVAVADPLGVVVVSVADGTVPLRTILRSPRSGLRVEDYSPVGVSFSR
jgi:hypothetical protein